MGDEEEIRELKERLASVENQLQQRSSNSRVLSFIVWFVIMLFVIMTTIGIIQFIKA